MSARRRWLRWPGLLLAGALLASAVPAQDALIDDMNPLLGPRYAQWLVGPIGEIVTKKERDAYLALVSDDQAERFIREFWSRPERAQIQGIYDQRAAEADELFTEAQVAGRRTDRGKVFILFGPPSKEEVEEFRNVDDPDVLLWSYDRKQVGNGLNGKKPAKTYRFVKYDDLTVLFRRGDRNDPVERRRRDPRSRVVPFE